MDILFYDDRNTASDMAGVFMARSLDGGQSWKEFEVSDHNYKHAPIGGLGQGYQGDNIDLTSTETKIWPVWMDNSSGIYQIWTVPVEFTSLDGIGSTSSEVPLFELRQNEPNPCSGTTCLRYQISDTRYLISDLFDISGRKICELLNEKKMPGEYNLEIDVSDLPDGIYIVKMRAGNEIALVKVLVVK